MKCLFSVASIAVILHIAGVVRADEEASHPTPAQVRTAAEAFDRGREAYKTEDYAEAAEQFESADANAPSAAALELAIRARDKAGQLDRAATLAALALARNPDDPSIQKLAPDIIQRAKTELFELDIKCDAPCDVTVADKLAPGRRSTERTVFVEPGKYAVRAGWPGERALSKLVEATPGASTSLDFTAPVVAPPVVKSPAELPLPENTPVVDTAQTSGPLPPAVFWVGVGLTAVVGGITVWSGVDTQNNPGANKVRAECSANNADCQSLYNQGVDKQHRTNILLGSTLGLGVLTGIVGAVLTDWSGDKKSEPSSREARRSNRFSIQPWISVGGGASVGALGRF